MTTVDLLTRMIVMGYLNTQVRDVKIGEMFGELWRGRGSGNGSE